MDNRTRMKLKSKRLLIRSTNWIGDAIMTTPAVRAIRRNFPGARISMLAKPWVVPVFAHSPHVDEIIVFDANGRHRTVGGKIRLARELRQYRFDTAIFLQNAIEAALIAFLAGIPQAHRIRYRRPPIVADRSGALHPVDQAHSSNRLLPGNARGCRTSSRITRIGAYVGQADKEQARRLLDDHRVDPKAPVVGLNPSATFGPAKQWFPERYAALGDLLRQACGATIVIFGGPSDVELGRSITGMMTGPAIDLSGRTRLGEAMALIDRCDAFVTNDSGLMHIAAALNTPLVAIFGSTNSTTTSPFSPTSRIVRVPIECSPCMQPVCPLGHMNCMKRVSVDMVAEAVRGLL
jgi:heptosyltransferase-2